MPAWLKNDLGRIADTDDLHISPLRDDGKTYGTPTWIWSVVVDGALYVRAYKRQGIAVVQGRAAAEGRADHGGGDDEGSHLRVGGRAHKRPH